MAAPRSPRRRRSAPSAAPGRVGLVSRRVQKTRPLRFIDLFAGIGGMRMAFERAGARCVFTSEYDKYAAQTYRANFEGEVHGDITAIEPGSIPNHEILIAGFPCQPFSIAGVSKKKSLGRSHGFEDPTQGTLFFNVKEILRLKRPRAFLLENVKNLVSHDSGNTFRIICRSLVEDLGYDVHWRVLDARTLVPQHRERIFIVGFREPRDFVWPRLPKQVKRLEEVLEAQVSAKYTLSDRLWDYLQGYAQKHRERGNGFGFGKFGPQDIARTLSARYYKDGSEILIDQGRKNPRRLTPRECARLMGFPDRFKIEVSDTRAYKQFGNSVVVPLVRTVAEAMLEVQRLPRARRPAGLFGPQLRVQQRDMFALLAPRPQRGATFADANSRKA